jgi:hypothetical protein
LVKGRGVSDHSGGACPGAGCPRELGRAGEPSTRLPATQRMGMDGLAT